MKNASLPEGFFLGQVPPGWNEYLRTLSWQEAHNNRVKVRIPGKHSKSGEIPDKDLPWAIVEQSTSNGNLNGSSVGLWGGEWVTGYFLDKDEQIPVITGVLGVNTIEDEKLDASIGGSTQFKAVKRFNSGLVAPAHAIGGGSKPKTPLTEIDKKTIKKATIQSPTLPKEATDGLRFKSPEEWWEGVQAAGGRVKNFFDDFLPPPEQSNEPNVRSGDFTEDREFDFIPSRDRDGNVYGQQ